MRRFCETGVLVVGGGPAGIGAAVAWRSGFLDIGFVRLDRMKIHGVP